MAATDERRQLSVLRGRKVAVAAASQVLMLFLGLAGVAIALVFFMHPAYCPCPVIAHMEPEGGRAPDRFRLLGASESLIVQNISGSEALVSDSLSASTEEDSLPLIIAVTPTHNRAAQYLHISKVVNVLRLVPPPILWIVVESLDKTEETALLLEKTAGRCIVTGIAKRCASVNYIHISSGKAPDNPRYTRGVGQRNAALEYVEKKRISGIMYFMDDDNVYTPMLFEEFRKMKRKVGVVPVGLLWSKEYTATVPWRQASPAVERALVEPDETGTPKVTGWETFEWSLKAEPGKGRKYHLDMAGFAFKSELLWTPTDNVTGKPQHPVRFRSRPAWIETLFLDRLVSGPEELDPLADSCQDVYIWHVKFESTPNEPYPKDWRIPQPQNLVPDPEPTKGISRYLNTKGIRQKIRHYKEPIPFGYKVIPKIDHPDEAESKKSKKSKN